MPEEIITRDSAAFKELYRDIVKAIRAVDILIDTHRPTIGNELYLTSEEICSILASRNAPCRITGTTAKSLILLLVERFFIHSPRFINCWNSII